MKLTRRPLILAFSLLPLALLSWPAVLFNPTNGQVILPTNFYSGLPPGGSATNDQHGVEIDRVATNAAIGAVNGGQTAAVTNEQQWIRFQADGVEIGAYDGAAWFGGPYSPSRADNQVNASQFVAYDPNGFLGNGQGLTNLNGTKVTGAVPLATSLVANAGVTNLNISGGSFSGNGSGLTSLQSAQLQGPIPAILLSNRPPVTASEFTMRMNNFLATSGLYCNNTLTGFGIIAIDDAGEYPTLSVYGSILSNTPSVLVASWDSFPMDVISSSGGMVIGGRAWPAGSITNDIGQGNLRVLNNLNVSNLLTAPSLTVSQAITNNGIVWLSLATNNTPAVTAPAGSICTTTNGQFFVRSNSVWLLK